MGKVLMKVSGCFMFKHMTYIDIWQKTCSSGFVLEHFYIPAISTECGNSSYHFQDKTCRPLYFPHAQGFLVKSDIGLSIK